MHGLHEVINFEGQHVGFLGKSYDDRFPVRIVFYDQNNKIVCVGCMSSLSHQGCLTAWGLVFCKAAVKSEIYQERWPIC
jgi:hypothetical protein